MRNRFISISSGMFLFSTLLLLSQCTEQKEHKMMEKAPSAAQSYDTVIIHEMRFDPAELTVEKGKTVVWINKGLVAHNVTDEKNKLLYSDTIRVDESWQLVVTENVDYFCSIHPTMKGKILVKK